MRCAGGHVNTGSLCSLDPTQINGLSDSLPDELYIGMANIISATDIVSFFFFLFVIVIVMKRCIVVFLLFRILKHYIHSAVCAACTLLI